MKSADENRQGTCQDTERSPNSTINRLPDEVLLEIFDSYRKSINRNDSQWGKKYAWFNLALVCRRWRAVMFASSSRLGLNIIVGPKKPGHIKTILSGHLPIVIDYWNRSGITRDMTDSALWRMRAALGHRDRVREISFGGWGDISIGKFIRATSYHFPTLESPDFRFPRYEAEIPSTFLRGSDRSDLRLRRLQLHSVSVASVSGLLFSATTLTELTLAVTSVFDPSQGSLLLSCLQGMQSLRSLHLTTPIDSRDSQSQHPVPKLPKDTVPLLKLTRFRYSGPTTLLNNLLSGLSAPFLQDARIALSIKSPLDLLYLSRVIDDVREEFWSFSVAFDMYYFLLLSTHSGRIDYFKPSFRFNVLNYSSNSIGSMKTTKLAMAEELALNFGFPSSDWTKWDDVFSLREFLRQFRSVRVLRVSGFVREVGHLLQQDDGEPILPVLEEVELSILRLTIYSDEEYERRAAEALAAFEPCERAGHLVKVYPCEQTQTPYIHL